MTVEVTKIGQVFRKTSLCSKGGALDEKKSSQHNSILEIVFEKCMPKIQSEDQGSEMHVASQS